MNNKISDIEVLRAVAVIFVCIEHLHLNLFTWGGPFLNILFGWTGMWSGVDLFFVISGFVIARNLTPKITNATDNKSFFRISIAFWIRRAWRLIPSAWFWLFFILVACIVFNESSVWGSFRANMEGALAAILNVANLRAWVVYGEYEVGATFPYWSLSLEEQFYIILPFLILFSGKKLPYILIAVVLIQLIFPRYPLAIILRTDALALGVLLALFERTSIYPLFKPTFMEKLLPQLIILFLLFSALAIVGGDDIHIPIEISLVAYISFILVFIASYNANYIVPAGAIKSILVWVGARSYAIYLIHIPAYFLTREIWYRIEPEGTVFNGSYTFEFLVTATALIVLLAELNFRFIEVPLRNRGNRISKDFYNKVNNTPEKIDR